MTNAEAIEILKANYPDACYEQLREAVDKAIKVLKAQKSIRCRDCKHWDKTWLNDRWGSDCHYCFVIDIVCEGDFYCGYAEMEGEQQ